MNDGGMRSFFVYVPLGIPAFSERYARESAESGVSSAGFIMHVQPAARAAPT